MRRRRWPALACATLIVASIAGASGPTPLRGELRLAGPHDDKGEPTPGQSHLYVSITDEAATALYTSLPGESREDPCTGHRVKARGNVTCYEIDPPPDTRHFCSFSIHLERGAVHAGLGGCI